MEKSFQGVQTSILPIKHCANLVKDNEPQIDFLLSKIGAIKEGRFVYAFWHTFIYRVSHWKCLFECNFMLHGESKSET